MRVDLDLEIDIARTPRVAQLEGLMDVPRADKSRVSFHFDVPLEQRDWQIGLITGPSGAGKSSVAGVMFPDEIVDGYEWAKGSAVVDNFGALGIREITAALNSVGFSSPPSWLKPFSVLSTGEKFRANMARALVDPRPRVVVDEFTSVIDRTVARIGSHALSKAIRRTPGKQFVAVTCHDDVVDWLQPDWVLEPHAGAFTWRSPQRRPTIELEIVRANREAWRWFSAHHYLTANLHRAAKCFVGLVGGRPAAFAGLLPQPHQHRRNMYSLSRLVVLPDYQGLGLGAYSFTEAIARIAKSSGKDLITHPSHPALVRTWAKSSLWRMTSRPKFGNRPGPNAKASPQNHVFHRKTAHFMWAGGGYSEPQLALKLWHAE
jgi:ABC-type thiamine transport system ATPase subunit